MSTHLATLHWSLRPGEDFAARRYSRVHSLTFEGGASVTGSASPAFVPAPWSDPAGVDPEAMFTASLSACHMLWFLDLAARAGWTVQSYADHAEGELGRDEAGRMAMTRVTLRPEVRYAGPRRPNAHENAALHEAAHHHCFLADSVRTEVAVQPVSLTQEEPAHG